jgi:hypothetical protein
LLICPHCSGAVRLGGIGYQYQTDLPLIEPMNTAFEIHYGFCTQCGRRVQARHPEQISDATGMVGGVQIGPHAIALAAHLNKVCGVSYERIAEMFGQVFGLGLERSTIARALLRLAERAEATYRSLIETIRGSPVVYPDETGWRIGGDKAWLWAVTTLTATVYLIERGRGFPEAAKILGEAFAGVIGADGWAPYRRFTNAERQLCLAHLLCSRCRQLKAARTTSARSRRCFRRHSRCAIDGTKTAFPPMGCASAGAGWKRNWTGYSMNRTCMTRAFALRCTYSRIAMRSCSS